MIDYFCDDESTLEIKCSKCGTIANPGDISCSVCQTKLEHQSPFAFSSSSSNSEQGTLHSPPKYGVALARDRIKTLLPKFEIILSSLFQNKVLVSSTIATTILGAVIFSQFEGEIFRPQSKPLPQNNETATANQIFKYGGSTCLVALLGFEIESPLNLFGSPYQFQFQSHQNPSDCSLDITPLLSGDLSFVYSNRPLTSSERQLARERKIELNSIPFATDAVVPFVNPDLNIAQLTIEQLRGIFSGRILNWQQLGGPDLSIVPVILNSVADADLTLLMGRDNYTVAKHSLLAPDYTSAVRKVSRLPGAISLASVAVVIEQESVNFVAVAREPDTPPVTALMGDRTLNHRAFEQHHYPLTRSLFIILPLDRETEKGVATYINFLLSPQGQLLIAKNGLIPLFPWN